MCAVKERPISLSPFSIVCLVLFSGGSVFFLIWIFRNHMLYFIFSLGFVVVVIVALLMWSFIFVYRSLVRRRVAKYAEEEYERIPEIIVLDEEVIEKPDISYKELAKRKEKLTKKLAPYIYYGELDKTLKCSLSNRILAMNDEIVRCPNCYAYFELSFLLKELVKEEICPICKEEIWL